MNGMLSQRLIIFEILGHYHNYIVCPCYPYI